VPAHLKDASRDAEGLGHGAGYLYPHAYRDHWVAQQYLPDNLVGRVFYQPTDQGYENLIREQVARRREAQLAAMLEEDMAMIASRVVYETTHQEGARRVDTWLQRTLTNVGEHLAVLRDRVVTAARIERHSLVLDLHAGTGLLTWEAVRRASAGGVWALARDERTAQALRQQAEQLSEMERPVILCGSLSDLPKLVAREWQQQSIAAKVRPDERVYFDVVIGRNALAHLADKVAAAKMIATLLTPDGRVSLAETVPRHGQRLHRLFRGAEMDEALYQRLVAAEEAIYGDREDVLLHWDADDLAEAFRAAGFADVQVETQMYTILQQIHEALLARWFSEREVNGRPSYAQRLRRYLSAEEIEQLRNFFEQLRGQVVDWQTCVAYLVARLPQS
jgi:putative ATPase